MAKTTTKKTKRRRPRKKPPLVVREIPATMGRPTLYSQALVDDICLRISAGETLVAICRTPGYPDRTTVMRWLADPKRKDFYDAYTKARIEQLDMWAEEIVEIAEDGRNDWVLNNDENNPGYRFNGEHYQRSRLRIDTRKWLLAKLNAKRYGDRIAVDADVKVQGSVEQILAEGAALGLTKEQLFGS